MRTLTIFCLAGVAIMAHAQQIGLNDVLRSARANRPLLQAANLRLSQSKLTSRALGAYPATRLFVGYTTDPETGGSDDDLVLSQPIDLFGRTSAIRRSGRALVAEAEASFRQISLDVQTEVLEAYLNAVVSSELAKSARAVQSVYEQLHEATRLRVEGGIAPGFHLTQVSLDLEQAKLRAEQRHAELEAALRKLESSTGLTELREFQGGFPDLVAIQADSEVLRRQRPELLLLQAQAQLAEADIEIARASGRPELELQGRRTPWQERNDRYGLRLQLSFPLFDHGRVASETKSAGMRAEAARKALDDATKLAEGEVRASQIAVKSASDQVGKYEALVGRAKDLVNRLRPGLTEQATTLIEVLDATRVLRDLEQAYVEARTRLAQAQARLIRASGQILEVKP
ncbi:MAG: TolC family protein [Fimbriimonadaceae bacterium]|nr:TolC family protein [Fimbriimonadaceae bacterium]QOJ11224.1 MAG: TolC family protein [Chthonomonadaceae bacterium]